MRFNTADAVSECSVAAEHADDAGTAGWLDRAIKNVVEPLPDPHALWLSERESGLQLRTQSYFSRRVADTHMPDHQLINLISRKRCNRYSCAVIGVS